MSAIFPKRIPEPKVMDSLEMKAFEYLSKTNFKRWIIPLADDIISVTKLRRGHILDAACGPGLLSQQLGQKLKNCSIEGLDFSKPAIHLAQINCKKLNNCRFKLGSVYKMPYSDNYFDLIVCKDSFHHFDLPKKVLKEMLRVLKKGSIIYIQDLRRDLPKYIFKKACPPDTTIKKLQYYSTRAAYTKNEIIGLLKNLNITEYSIQTKNLTSAEKTKYASMGILPQALKESLQSRFRLIIQK